MNRDLISLIQIISGIVLGILILIQAKGTGLGSTFGGEISFYRTKRGFEKLIFRATIAVATLFLISAAYGLLM